MRILSNQQTADLLGLDEIIAAVEAAMISYEDNTSTIPKRMHIDHGDNTLLCMPSFTNDFFATKLVSVVPGNKEKGLPVTNGAMLLNDTSTGMPLALLNAARLTALRTGAVGAIGARYTTPDSIDSIGLIGLGIQGMHQAVFACSIRPIKKIYVLKRGEENYRQFIDFLHSYHSQIEIIPCSTPEELLKKTTVIIAATTSGIPVFNANRETMYGKHFYSIGSYKPSMQELPDEVYAAAGYLVIDSDFARTEVGDIINPIRNGLIVSENVFTIGKLITGARKININHTTVFKSAGMALFDLFVAKALYKAAIKKNIGTDIEI